MEVCDAPPDYEFDHPCGNVATSEEVFFYDPKNPRPKAIIVREADKCLGCACYSVDQITGRGKCQGLQIILELDVKISYNKETREYTYK